MRGKAEQVCIQYYNHEHGPSLFHIGPHGYLRGNISNLGFLVHGEARRGNTKYVNGTPQDTSTLQLPDNSLRTTEQKAAEPHESGVHCRKSPDLPYLLEQAEDARPRGLPYIEHFPRWLKFTHGFPDVWR